MFYIIVICVVITLSIMALYRNGQNIILKDWQNNTSNSLIEIGIELEHLRLCANMSPKLQRGLAELISKHNTLVKIAKSFNQMDGGDIKTRISSHQKLSNSVGSHYGVCKLFVQSAREEHAKQFTLSFPQ